MTANGIAWGTCQTLLGSAFAVAAQAQPFDTAPLPAPPRLLDIAAPTEQRLPNGLRVVLATRPGVGLVTAQLVVLSGSEVDPPKRAGLAALTAALLTKGTRGRSASMQAREAESLGGSLDSGAGWNQSQVAATVMVTHLDPALGLIGDAVMRPSFAPAELERLRAQTRDGFKVTYAQPGTLAALAADRLLFGAHPYGHPVDGTPASLQRITRADLVALHRARYRPDNAVLLLAGDLDAATALRLAARHFGAWKAPGQALPAPSARSTAQSDAAPDSVLPSLAAIDMPRADQAAVVVAMPLPPLGTDRATVAVLNAVLGGDFSSRLNQEIRIRRGLSYGVSSQLDARPEGGALRIVVQTRTASAAKVVALVQAELDRLIATPVPDDELAARKAALIGNFSRSVETTAGLGRAMQSLVVAGLPASELRHRISALTAVTAGAVQRFAASHLGVGGRRVVVAGDAAVFGAAVQGGGPAVLTVKQGQIDLEREDSLTTP